MGIKIDSVSARDKLKIRREPYWHRLSRGRYLGYRKMIVGPGGSWVARSLDASTAKQTYKAMGNFSESADNLRFDIAQKTARGWFEHLDKGGATTEITVGEACRRYVQKQIDEGKQKAAKDCEVRFKRWMFSESSSFGGVSVH